MILQKEMFSFPFPLFVFSIWFVLYFWASPLPPCFALSHLRIFPSDIFKVRMGYHDLLMALESDSDIVFCLQP